MTTKHTPGPWIAAPYQTDAPGFAVGLSIYHDGTAAGFAETGNDYLLLTSHELTEANARLIAAAPDLLEAVIYQLDLNKWIESADSESPFFEETLRLRLNTANDYMTAAIAKATGEAAP